jgi:hypothetical protein
MKRQAAPHEREPLRVELRRNVERLARDRPIDLLQVGEGAIRKPVVAFRLLIRARREPMTPHRSSVAIFVILTCLLGGCSQKTAKTHEPTAMPAAAPAAPSAQ